MRNQIAGWIIKHCHETCGRVMSVERETALMEADTLLPVIDKKGAGAWVSIKDKLPAINTCVALVNMHRHFSFGPHGCVKDIGTRSELGYWSTIAHGAQMIDAYTHWCLLPNDPMEGE
jgi:hypothetical protein